MLCPISELPVAPDNRLAFSMQKGSGVCLEALFDGLQEAGTGEWMLLDQQKDVFDAYLLNTVLALESGSIDYCIGEENQIMMSMTINTGEDAYDSFVLTPATTTECAAAEENARRLGLTDG